MAKPFWRRPVVIIPAAIVVVGGAAFVVGAARHVTLDREPHEVGAENVEVVDAAAAELARVAAPVVHAVGEVEPDHPVDRMQLVAYA